MTEGLCQADIARVHEVIATRIRLTPVLHASGHDLGLAPFRLTLKLEFTQHGGSFKARGAFTHLLTRPIPSSGAVAASGGNHGIAVAYAARHLNIPAKIFVPTVSSPVKVARIRAYGADVVITGDRYADALEASERYAAESHALVIHAYDQLETLLGQGTLARELATQVPQHRYRVCRRRGRRFAWRVAAWCAAEPSCVMGVEPAGAPTLTEALKAGRPSMRQPAASPPTPWHRAVSVN